MASAAPFNSNNLPQPIAGFEMISRYWDRKMNIAAAKILPGELYVSVAGEMISTVLGSCIAVCIRDKKLGIGGMNHFMLPEQKAHSSDHWTEKGNGMATRYGNWAMECLINEILKAGGSIENFEVKIFGGGAVLKGVSNIGLHNVEFVTAYLKRENLRISAQDVGDVCPRKVLYFAETGAVKVKRMKLSGRESVTERETAYIADVIKKDSYGSIDLF